MERPDKGIGRNRRNQDDWVERTFTEPRGMNELSVLEAMTAGEKIKLALLDSSDGKRW